MAKNKQQNTKPWYMAVYITRHGCSSETIVLHVGYSQFNTNNGYPTWFSEPLTLEEVESINKKVKYLDGSSYSIDYAKKQILSLIKELKSNL